MIRRPLLLLLVLLLPGLALSAPVERPNVLFLAVDDMNDWIGPMGTTPRAITPNLDKLAARGVTFTNAHTAGVYCAPSRAAIFSGQFASTTGCYQTSTYWLGNPEIEALQMSFAKAGYTTLGAGKLFHHPAGNIDQRGWSEFFLRNKSQRTTGWPLDSWSEETPFPDPFPASIYNKDREVTGGLFLEWGAIPDAKEEEMADTMRINWAVEQLGRKHDPSTGSGLKEPFFLACGLYAPHFPNYCPQKYFDLYDPEEIELPPYRKDDLADLPEKIRKMKTNAVTHPPAARGPRRGRRCDPRLPSLHQLRRRHDGTHPRRPRSQPLRRQHHRRLLERPRLPPRGERVTGASTPSGSAPPTCRSSGPVQESPRAR